MGLLLNYTYWTYAGFMLSTTRYWHNASTSLSFLSGFPANEAFPETRMRHSSGSMAAKNSVAFADAAIWNILEK